MNELLLALKSSYSSISTSRTNSSRTSTASGNSQFFDASNDMSSFVDITTPPTHQSSDVVPDISLPPSHVSDSPYRDPITPLKPSRVEFDGPDNPLLDISPDESPLTSPDRSPHHHLRNPSPPDPDQIFTPRTRKKWSQCANNLFVSYRQESSDSDTSDNVKETSIDGIFIEFDNNIPKIVDKKRCSHISALARVTCVHLRAPKFVKRRATSTGLKSKSCEKMQDDKSSTGTNKRTNKRPHSADAPLKKEAPREPEPEPEVTVQSVDPLSYLLETRAYKASRESLSESTESMEFEHHPDDGSDFAEDYEMESRKEEDAEMRNRRFSVDEHFLEEGRYHQIRELEHDPGTLRNPPAVS